MSAEPSQVIAPGAPALRWKPYPAYKDSGVEWLGKVPEHWEVRKLKYLVKGFLKYGANESAELEDTNLPRYIRITDFGNNGKLKQDTFKSLPLEIAKDYLLESGDILFARSGATVGKTFQFKNHKGLACFAGYLIKATPDEEKVLSDYLYLFTKSNSYEIWKNSIFIQSTIQNIGADKYNFLQITVPPIPEQRAIARFLDDRTQKIDFLIEKKQKLIELLKEERAAVINQAVTKGLDPRAPMRDSGVEWLGKIPKHWEVTRLKFICSIIKDGTHQPPSRQEVGIPLLSVRNIVNSKFVNLADDSHISMEDYKELKSSLEVVENDILLAIVGATLGKVAIVGKMDPFAIQRSLAVFRPIKKLMCFKHLAYFFQSSVFQRILWKNAGFSAQPGIYLETLENFHCALPSVQEQQHIVIFLDSETERIDGIISRIEKEIALLQEYRISLISEIVTGKIDVRGECETEHGACG